MVSNLDLPSDVLGSDARRRVAIERCKPCTNPHDSGDMPKYPPAGLTQYMLYNFPRSPRHTTSLKTTFRTPPAAGGGADDRSSDVYIEYPKSAKSTAIEYTQEVQREICKFMMFPGKFFLDVQTNI